MITLALVVGGVIWLNANERPRAQAPQLSTQPPQQHTGRLPCELVTPGLQMKCWQNGKLRPAGPAWPRQEKAFDACVAKHGLRFRCLDEAAKVK